MKFPVYNLQFKACMATFLEEKSRSDRVSFSIYSPILNSHVIRSYYPEHPSSIRRFQKPVELFLEKTLVGMTNHKRLLTARIFDTFK